MEKRNEKSNTGEAGKDKRGRTVSDDPGGKSLSGGLGGLPGEKVQPRRMPRGTTLTRQWEKVEVMKRKTGNLRTTMRMDTGVEVLPNDQEHNGESYAASTSELVQWSGQLQTTVVMLLLSAKLGDMSTEKILIMPNGGTQVVQSHFLKCHTELNVMIRGLQNTVGADQDPPHFLKLLTTEKPHTVVACGVM